MPVLYKKGLAIELARVIRKLRREKKTKKEIRRFMLNKLIHEKNLFKITSAAIGTSFKWKTPHAIGPSEKERRKQVTAHRKRILAHIDEMIKYYEGKV